jgi:hypothetical protein
MKIRHGFVSKSSSSSFLVGFPKDKIPTTIDELKFVLFGDVSDTEVLVSPTGSEEPIGKIVDFIWRSFSNQKPLRGVKLSQELDGYDVYCPFVSLIDFAKKCGINPYGHSPEDYDRVLERYETEKSKAEHDALFELVSKHKNLEFFQFDFCDECGGLEAFLERADVFRNLVHYTRNNH